MIGMTGAWADDITVSPTSNATKGLYILGGKKVIVK